MKGIASVEKFAESVDLKPLGDILPVHNFHFWDRIRIGEDVDIEVAVQFPGRSESIRLRKKLAEGGEGSIFETSISGYVGKIYNASARTTDKLEKLEIMISKPISCEGICFPEALIYNEENEFIGCLEKAAEGLEVEDTLFRQKVFQQEFPSWTKRDTIDICIQILEKVKYLNERNVILGDISLENILMTPSKKVYFVDCDSYQIEGYPCPVGNLLFVPPEVQGLDCRTYLRTPEMENYAIAMLLFTIMVPGQSPYVVHTNERLTGAIKAGEFRFLVDERKRRQALHDKWVQIWIRMPYEVRLAFYEHFQKGEKHFEPNARYDASQWLKLFKMYRHGIDAMMKVEPSIGWIYPARTMGEQKNQAQRS